MARNGEAWKLGNPGYGGQIDAPVCACRGIRYGSDVRVSMANGGGYRSVGKKTLWAKAIDVAVLARAIGDARLQEGRQMGHAMAGT